MYPDPTTGDAFMAMNTGLGQTRIITKVDPTSKQGLIQFYSDDAGSAGTLIGTSTIRTQNLVVSTLSTLNAYVQNVRISTAIISTVAIQTGLISSLIYTSIVGPTILQVQTITF